MGKINLKPLSESVGAEILSINLTDLRATEFKEIRSALDTYGGLLFRNQELSPENLVVFSKMFGDLDHAPQMENGKTAVEGFPEIYFVSNILDDNDKPIGSLGKLELLALKLALITGKEKIKLHNPTILIFAGDHGIAKENISIAPSEVTKQMVLNFLNGGAAINCFCNENEIAIEVIDAGILSPLDNEPRLTSQRLGPGTKNFINTKAMSMETVVKGLKFGANNSYKHAES